MVKIEKSEIVQRVIDGLRLNQHELLSKEINTDFIKPVFITNENGKYKYFKYIVSTNTFDIVVPSGVYWMIQTINCTYTADATVGNRVIRFLAQDSASNTYFQGTSDENQTAGLIFRYMTNSLQTDTSSVVSGNIFLPISKVLLSGHKFKIYDNSNISASDSMIIEILYQEFSENA